MAIIYKQNGGLNPVPFVGQKSGQASVFGCDQDFQTNMHSTYPYKHNRVSIGKEDFGDGCVCTTDEVLAVGDIVVLAEIPAGQMLKDVKYRVGSVDPTFQFDLEVRTSASLATPATVDLVLASGLGNAPAAGLTAEDGLVQVNRFFSEFGVVACPGKDCYGGVTTGPGRQHGVLTMRVTALPTGLPVTCSTGLKQFGAFQADFDLVVTDLR
jgi:hypothetical protein